MESAAAAHQLLEPGLGAADPELGGRVRAIARGVLTDRLSKFLRVAEHVAQIVGDLVGFPERLSERRATVQARAPAAAAPAMVEPTNSAPVLARW